MKQLQNFFIDILPLFANAIVALVVIFLNNKWLGLVYFWLSYAQATRTRLVIIPHSLAQIVDSECIYVMKKATW